MPELPDIVLYNERLTALLQGQVLRRLRFASPFVLRSFDPAARELEGRTVLGFRRMGKRIVFELDGGYFIVLHLMISGRLRWNEPGANVPKKVGLAAFDFDSGTLILTEASTTKRVSIHLVRGTEGLAPFERGGLEPLDATLEQFTAALRKENRTLKRALTDPSLFSGIGNAYSDEILHRARLSPVQRSHALDAEQTARLYEATRAVLLEWLEILRQEVGTGFPREVTAFRAGFAVHGKFKEPCPVCGTKVQRVRFADNELNYCPECQTGGKLLADRGLSRLLKGDWPKTLSELEERLESDARRPAAAPSATEPRRQAASRRAAAPLAAEAPRPAARHKPASRKTNPLKTGKP